MRGHSFALFITFLCSLVATTHEANRKFADHLLGSSWSASKNRDIDEDMAEQVWLHCRKELLEIAKDFDYSDFYAQPPASSDQNMVESDMEVLKRRILHKTITDLPFHGKQTLLNCLDRELIHSQISRRNSAIINWHNLFFDWSSIPRRFLQRKKNAPKPHQHPKPEDTSGKPTRAAARRAGVPSQSSSTTLNVKYDKSSPLSPSDAGTSPEASKDPTDVTTPGPAASIFGALPTDVTTPGPAASIFGAFANALEQLKTKEAESPAPKPSSTENNNSPSPSPAEESNSPAPSPPERSKSSAPSPPEKSKSPAPSPPERSKSPAPSPPEKSKSPAPSPSGKSKAPEPSPLEDSESPEISPVSPQPEDHVATPTKRSKHKTSVIAGYSVAGAAVVAVFLFCGVSRRKKREVTYGQTDDRPFSYFSGSLETPIGVADSSKTGYNSSGNESNFHTGPGIPGASGDGKLPLPPGKRAAPLAPKPSSPPSPPPSPPSPPSPPPPPPPPEPPAPKAPPPPKVANPPPPKVANPPPQPPKPSPFRPSSTRLYSKNAAEGSEDQKARLKPFFWDKVANPDQSMVWHDLKAGSFEYSEEMMENLFGYKAAEQRRKDRKKGQAAFEAPKYIQIIDPRKAQNLSIILKAQNVTTDKVCDAILEGNELPSELVETLLKMAPTTDEELKLRLYNGDLSELGPAERFLKAMVEIPFAFKRLESLLFMYTLDEEISTVKESFANIELACNEIKNSRLFLKLLEAVLKTGNRMNDGTNRGGAQAFRLDTLLKLSDVKGIDGKTTLLHFVVLEIIRSEGIRAARKEIDSQSIISVKTEDMLDNSTKETAEYVRNLGIEIVSNLSNELESVAKAAHVDGDVLRSTVLKLGHSLTKSKDFLKNEMDGSDGEGKFSETLASFLKQAEDDITWLLEEEKKMTSLIQSTTDYFHGNAGKYEGLHLFAVVRDFLTMVNKVVNEVKKSTKTTKNMSSTASSATQKSRNPLSPTNNLQQHMFPAIKQQRRYDSSSSDDES